MAAYRMPPPGRLVVLLSGWAGCGKDTAAALLVDELGFDRLAFADALKADVAARTGIPLAVFHSARKNEPLPTHEGQTPRDLLIARAAAVRATDPDAYARVVATQIADSGGGRYVITDWRFRNEYAVLCGDATTTILRVRVVRPDMQPMTDATEHELDNEVFDAVVQNEGSIRDLCDAMKTVLRPHLHRADPLG